MTAPRLLQPATAAAGIITVIFSILKLVRAPSKGDFEVYLHASRQLLMGANIYLTPANESGLYYAYPPLFAVLTTPLAAIPANLAVILWCVLNAFLIVWITRKFFELVSESKLASHPPLTRWAVTFLPILLCSRFLIHHLDLGQVNILVMALVIWTLALLTADRLFWAGVVLAVASTIKPVVAPFAIFLLFRGSPAALAGLAAGGAAALLLPGLVLGFVENLEQIRFWIASFALDTTRQESMLPLIYNFSPRALLYRLFTPVPAFIHEGRAYPLTLLPLSQFVIEMLDWMVRGGILAAISAVWFRYQYGKGIQKYAAWALMFAMIPWLFPSTQKHYFVFLLPAYTYATYGWWILGRNRTIAALVLGSFVLTSLTNRTFVGEFAAAALLMAGIFLWGAMLLAAAVVWTARCAGNVRGD